VGRLRESGKIVGPVGVKQVANRCNLQFPLSLRQFLNTPRCPFPSCVVIHIKVLQQPPPSAVPIETMISSMRQVYSTARIRVVVGSRENLTGSAFSTLLDLNVGACVTPQALTGEQTTLYGNRNNVGANDIAVYFVRSTFGSPRPNGNLNGCAGPTTARSVVITQVASEWTLAHEVGHVLELNHVTGEICPPTGSPPTRLMTGCGTGRIIGTPTITQNEIDTMDNSNLTNPC